jgi:hypothetical protein
MTLETSAVFNLFCGEPRPGNANDQEDPGRHLQGCCATVAHTNIGFGRRSPYRFTLIGDCFASIANQ